MIPDIIYVLVDYAACTLFTLVSCVVIPVIATPSTIPGSKRKIEKKNNNNNNA